MEFTCYPLSLLLLFTSSSYQWNADYIFKIVTMNTRVIQTQEFLMFYCKACKDERIDQLVGRIHRAVGISQYVSTNHTSYNLRDITKRNYWAMVFTYSIDDFIFEVHDKTLRGFHYYFGMIVLLDPVDDFKVIEKLLLYLYKKHFTTTHVYFASTNLTDNFYGFQTYPEFQVENRKYFLEDLPSMLGKFINRGVMGYAFRSPLQADVPGVFKFKNRDGKTEVQGTSYRIFKTFADHMGGLVVDYPTNTSTNSVNMREVLQLIRDDKIAIAVHAYALYNKSGIDQSYPLLVVQWCLMVPSFNGITNHLYTIKPFAGLVWLLYLLSTVAFILVSYLYEKVILQKANFGGCVLVGLSLMLNIAAPKTFRDPRKWEFFILSVIFLNAAAVTIFYTSFLGSILTVNLFRQQINTLDDLVAAKIQVMMIDYEYEFLRSTVTLAPEFEKLILIVDPDTLSMHRDAMNSTYAYMITDDRWHFIALQQKYLKQPKFRLSDICFGSFHMGFPMELDSPVWRDLEYFIYRVHSSGLYQYYESVAYEYAVLGGYAQRLTAVDDYKSAGFEHLMFAFVLQFVVCTLGGVIFLCEVIIGRNKKVNT